MSRDKAKDQRNHRRRIQTGRSLFEMIMVICIMMLFSIGGYAGYCSAVCGYKANKAMEEIQNIAEGVKKNSSYGKNYFGFDVNISYSIGMSYPVFVVSYTVPQERMCQHILLSKFPDDFQSKIDSIVVSPEIDNGMKFEWIGEDYPNSSTVRNALEACALSKDETPITIQYVFK